MTKGADVIYINLLGHVCGGYRVIVQHYYSNYYTRYGTGIGTCHLSTQAH